MKYTKRIIEMGTNSLSKRKEQFFCIGDVDTLVITKTQHATDPVMYSIDCYPSRSDHSRSANYPSIEQKEFDSVFKQAKSTFNKITKEETK